MTQVMPQKVQNVAAIRSRGANQTGGIHWKHTHGTIQDMTPLPLQIAMGVPGIGSPIIMPVDVAFLAVNMDNYFRAYCLTNGKQLW